MCVRVLIGTTSIRPSKDNHDSWVTCTTSTECKTVITTVFTVMSGIDPHMISENPGMGNGLIGFIWLWVDYGETL
jgi:hypothetical protein